MSLFPAYAQTNTTIQEEVQPDDAFLSFSSYKIEAPSTSSAKIVLQEEITANESSSSSDSSYETRKRKKKKHNKEHKRPKSNSVKLKEAFKDKEYVIDKSKELVFLKVNKISRPAVAKYRYSSYVIGTYMKPQRKQTVLRYFKSKYLIQTKLEDDRKEEKDEDAKKTLESGGFQLQAEDDISKKTAFYNQALGEDPYDVATWLQYIRYQDTVWLFEKTYKKGSIAKGSRVTAERKLSILDKALTHNPDNENLSREKVLIAERVYPADELSKYLKTYVEKSPGNIIYWQGYIEATQCSMSHCNTPAVISIYNTCLTKLHQLRRVSTMEKSLLETRILTMLYQCGLFLRQAGLWEQLWTLLQLYLELNLASNDKSKFTPPIKFDEKQLIELEEVILDSQLPLHELWLRVEKLRESCHWLPWTGAQSCEDPQRTVFIEDVSDLIHPITSTGNAFRLTVMILTLLKIPLLPSRHSTIKELGLDYVPWALDTIESLYPIFFSLYPIDLTNEYLLKDAAKLAVGPQYLKTHPGQEEYLNFLVVLMKNCAECLETERTALYVWWLRFERLLIVLHKEKRFKMPAGRNKKTKSSIKEFLKHDSNRNNIIFYREYALIEYELGNVESAFKILLTTIQSNNNAVILILNANERANLCSLYRTIVELLLNEKTDIESNKQKAISYLVTLITGSSANINSELINEVINKYKHISTELLDEPQTDLMVSQHFLPDYLTDFIICYGWMVFLVKTPFEAGTMIENVLTSMEKSNNDILFRREVLMEWYVTIFYKTCTEQLGSGMYGLFNDILYRALSLFPNNLYLLAVACKEQSSSGCVGKPWWKLSNTLTNCGHAMPALFLVIMANQQLAKIKDEWDDFDIGNPVATMTSYKNRMLSIFSRLIKTDMCTKRCGLLWRLYLQYLYIYSDSDTCRKAYYGAVEECPWLKALYIDAAIYIPAELPQIQDLIIEKELRIHVTPEELDVLRS